MARRGHDMFDLLVTLPWWVSVLCSLAAYAGLAHVLPAVMGRDHRLLGPFSRELLPRLALVVAAVFLVPAAKSALASSTDNS